MSAPSPAEVLASLISNIASGRDALDAKRKAIIDAAAIAIPAILRAAAAGNVQCKEAAREMQPFLTILTNK